MRGHCGAQHDVRRLGIEPEIEFMPRAVREFRIVGLRIEASAHHHNPLCQFRKLRIDRDGQRDVRQRAGCVDRHLVRMRAHLPNQKMRGVLVNRLGVGMPSGIGGIT